MVIHPDPNIIVIIDARIPINITMCPNQSFLPATVYSGRVVKSVGQRESVRPNDIQAYESQLSSILISERFNKVVIEWR